MLRIDDVTGKSFAKTRRGDGYEVGDVEQFRADVTEAIIMRDTVINKLREEQNARERDTAVLTPGIQTFRTAHRRLRWQPPGCSRSPP